VVGRPRTPHASYLGAIKVCLHYSYIHFERKDDAIASRDASVSRTQLKCSRADAFRANPAGSFSANNNKPSLARPYGSSLVARGSLQSNTLASRVWYLYVSVNIIFIGAVYSVGAKRPIRESVCVRVRSRNRLYMVCVV
jgi:hypothetical protein